MWEKATADIAGTEVQELRSFLCFAVGSAIGNADCRTDRRILAPGPNMAIHAKLKYMANHSCFSSQPAHRIMNDVKFAVRTRRLHKHTLNRSLSARVGNAREQKLRECVLSRAARPYKRAPMHACAGCQTSGVEGSLLYTRLSVCLPVFVCFSVTLSPSPLALALSLSLSLSPCISVIGSLPLYLSRPHMC